MKLEKYEDLVQEIKDKFVVVFGGFSGLGYEEKDRLKEQMKEDLQKYINEHGKDNLAVVCGATPEGVGIIYEVAKSLDLKTYGIVSTAALEYSDNPQSAFCDTVLFSKQLDGVWTVKNKQDQSLMVDIATQGQGGLLHYYNGGEVALDEIKEAKQRGVPVEINFDFKPNAANVAKRVEKAAKNGNEFIAEPLLALQAADNVKSTILEMRNPTNKKTSSLKLN